MDDPDVILASTDTPMVWPIIQWLGSGLGHSGSTSKRGAWTAEASALRRENAGADSERDNGGEKRCADIKVPFHVEILYQTRLNCMRLLLMVLVASFASPLGAWAHDIPNDVTVQAFLKPEGQRLRLLVRAPAEGHARRRVSAEGAGLSGSGAHRAAPGRCRDAVDRRCHRDLRKRHAAAEAAGGGDHGVARIDRSFATYEDALAHVTGAGLPLDTNVVWNQTMLDVLVRVSDSIRALGILDSSRP